MPSIQINILNPKAGKLLKEMADLKLITIREKVMDDGFLRAIEKIRSKGKLNSISLEEITKEVEAVRAKQYAKNKA